MIVKAIYYNNRK